MIVRLLALLPSWRNDLCKICIDKFVHLFYIYPGREGINLVFFPGTLEIFNYPPALNKK